MHSISPISVGMIRLRDTNIGLKSMDQPSPATQSDSWIPVPRNVLVERLTQEQAWRGGEALDVRQFFSYLDQWRQQRYAVGARRLAGKFEPFSPDGELPRDAFTADELIRMKSRFMDGAHDLLDDAGFQILEPEVLQSILNAPSPYGLDLNVDLGKYDECIIAYRGASSIEHSKRTLRSLFRRETIHIPIFQRLFILFKLKPIGRQDPDHSIRVNSRLEQTPLSDGESIHLKLFRNIPRSDIALIFPNATFKFRLLDKIMLGVISGGAIAAGMLSIASKSAAAIANPIAMAAALAGLGAIVFRQAMKFGNMKVRYMAAMGRTLYFHSMADDRMVLAKLAEDSAEQDTKEDALVYSVLAKKPARRSDLDDIKAAIDQYLHQNFALDSDINADAALDRLMGEEFVFESANGELQTIPAAEAVERLDSRWDTVIADAGEAIEKHRETQQQPPAAKTPPPSPVTGMTAEAKSQNERNASKTDTKSERRHIFVSHASEDQAIAEKLVNLLERRGLTCWYAPRDIPAGSDYQETIVTALETMRAMIVVLSEAATRSRHVKREISLADDEGKEIFPLRLDTSRLTGVFKYQLGHRQWTSVGDDLETAAENLVERVG